MIIGHACDTMLCVRDAEGGETTPSFGRPSNVRRGETTPSFGHPSNVRRAKAALPLRLSVAKPPTSLYPS